MANWGIIMAFNTLEYLEKGLVDFVYNLTEYDYKNLIRYVRESDRRFEIVKGFLAKLRDSKPYFCFDIIYDMEKFMEDTRYLLNNYYNLDSFSKEQFELFLNNSSLGFDYLEENFEEVINKFQKDLDFIFKFLFDNLDRGMLLLKKLAYHSDLHIRYLFMKYMLLNNSQYVNLFYDDITRYLSSETFQELEQLSFFKEYMDMKDVCELAYIYFDSNIDYFIWEKFKKFILENYKYNELAYRLLNFKKEYIGDNSYRLIDNKMGMEEFNKDADVLFLTSSNYRLNILNRYSEKVSRELIDSYISQLKYFECNGKIDDVYSKLDIYGLGRKVTEFVDKYLALSDDRTYSFVGKGSTASCYRIGDYVFKLVRTKWSYEKEICPNLYIILSNLEECFVRDERGVVLSGIEVQRYLSRDVRDVPKDIFIKLRSELRRLGYYSTDSFIDGPCGDNCRLLDSYLDSGNLNPPDWFMEYPVVLIDRDRIYRNDNKLIKQLSSGY